MVMDTPSGKSTRALGYDLPLTATGAGSAGEGIPLSPSGNLAAGIDAGGDLLVVDIVFIGRADLSG